MRKVSNSYITLIFLYMFSYSTMFPDFKSEKSKSPKLFILLSYYIGKVYIKKYWCCNTTCASQHQHNLTRLTLFLNLRIHWRLRFRLLGFLRPDITLNCNVLAESKSIGSAPCIGIQYLHWKVGY